MCGGACVLHRFEMFIIGTYIHTLLDIYFLFFLKGLFKLKLKKKLKKKKKKICQLIRSLESMLFFYVERISISRRKK